MNIKHVEQLRAFAKWAKETTDKSANFEINIWNHKSGTESIEYRLWIEDIINQSTKDSAMLIALIPYMQGLCTKHKIKENHKTLQEVAA